MKIQPKLLAAVSLGIAVAAMASCNNPGPAESNSPENDTLAAEITDTVRLSDSLSLPDCGPQPKDSVTDGIIYDGHDCPACGMG